MQVKPQALTRRGISERQRFTAISLPDELSATLLDDRSTLRCRATPRLTAIAMLRNPSLHLWPNWMPQRDGKAWDRPRFPT